LVFYQNLWYKQIWSEFVGWTFFLLILTKKSRPIVKDGSPLFVL